MYTQFTSCHHLLDDNPPLIEWEFYPHVGPRPNKGFVGLKNAGATCYMNSVLQQVCIVVVVVIIVVVIVVIIVLLGIFNSSYFFWRSFIN